MQLYLKELDTYEFKPALYKHHFKYVLKGAYFHLAKHTFLKENAKKIPARQYELLLLNHYDNFYPHVKEYWSDKNIKLIVDLSEFKIYDEHSPTVRVKRFEEGGKIEGSPEYIDNYLYENAPINTLIKKFLLR